MSKCAVLNCKSSRYRAGKTNAVVIIHSFPLQKDLYQKWVKFCRQDENWKPSGYFGICSNHFRNEDYQFFYSSVVENKRRSRMLFPNAIPSIFQSPIDLECVKSEPNTGESHAKIENMDAMSADADDTTQTDSFSELLKYRDHFCRICLNCYEAESLISIYSQIQNNTVLDMLIQLTAFETENYDEFPTVICVECKHKLEQACDIRQHFIVQSELLVRLVAEEKIMDHFRGGTVTLENAVEFEPKDGSYDTASNGESYHEDDEVDPEDDEKHRLESIEPNDHVVCSKSDTQSEDADGTVKLEDGVEMLAEAEKAYEKGIRPNVQRRAIRRLDKKRKKKISWKHLTLSSEEARKRKAEILRERARAYSLACNRKRYRLEAEAQNSFPLTTCYICDKKHDTLMERDFHLRDHIPMLPYHCKECNEDNAAAGSSEKDKPAVLKTTNQLNAHFRMHSMPYKCDKCYRRFCTDLKLKTHYWSSHGIAEKGLTCEYCGKQYFQRTMFTRHVAYHRNELSGQFKCSICDRALGSNSSLRRHEASHKKEKKYKCLYCEKLFSTSYNRLTHQRLIHTGELPHKCNECGRSFVDNSRLKLHQETHHSEGRSPKERNRKSTILPEDKQSCSYPGCNYTAETYRNMYMHKRTKHMTMHKCEVCKKEFPFIASLREHMMVHTGEKPYSCEVCDRSFRHSAMYRRHLLTHSDSGSSYSCSLCNKTFKMARYLQAHMQTHSSERNFICGICGNTYKTKGELKKHTQNKHANEFKGDYVILSGDSTVAQNQWVKTYATD